jgi:hypothetical protein
MTTHRPWLFSHNTFNTATVTNFSLADKLNVNHLEGLKAEVLIDITVQPRVEAFEAVATPYHEEYVKHLQLTGEVKSATQTVNNDFHDLGLAHSKAWVHAIAGKYAEGSGGYIRLLPKGRKPLYQGTFTHRLAALDALALSLSTEAAPLDDLYDIVKDFITNIKAHLQNQKDFQEKLKDASANLETLRIKCMNQMYSDLGFFMEKYPDSPKDIERTFDLTSIRHFALAAEEGANEYLVKILAGHQVEAGIAINPIMKLMFSNLTPLPIKIFLSSSSDPDQPVPETFYILAPEAQEELFVAQLGDPSLRYMFILNENSLEDAEVSIMILN